MIPLFRISLLAVTLIAALGTVPALAQRAGRGGPDFHGGRSVGPHPRLRWTPPRVQTWLRRAAWFCQAQLPCWLCRLSKLTVC